jgi:hypothetical protein
MFTLVPDRGQRPVQLAVNHGHDPEQRFVEGGHDRPDLVDRVHGLDPQLRGPPQQVDVLAQPAARLGAVGRARPLVVDHAEQLADPAQRRHHGPAAGLGGMRGQHQVHAQFLEVCGPRVAGQLGHGGGERLAHRLGPGVALAQHPDALVLLGQVGQVEVHGEGARHLLGPVQVPGGDQGRDRLPGPPVAPFLLAGLDHGVPQPLHVGQQAGAGRIADDLPEEVAEQPDVASHRLRQFGPVPVPATFPVRDHSVRAHWVRAH